MTLSSKGTEGLIKPCQQKDPNSTTDLQNPSLHGSSVQVFPHNLSAVCRLNLNIAQQGVTHCGHYWDLYPSLFSKTLSSKHKARLIGWVFLCLPGSLPNIKRQTLCVVLTFPLSFIPGPLTLPCSACQYFLLSAKTLLLLYSTATHPLIPSLSDDTGPQGFLPDLIWNLAVAKGCLSTPHALLRIRALVCFWKYFSLSWSYYIRNLNLNCKN